ncbi:MAG: divalent-cation tolerance protein CutA [Candidatus Omnitrophica bacterium]|nr:divalent-cation tolerance protein CutA [Candidatus Omnitrophota bacterium]
MYNVVLITTPSIKEAKCIAKVLLEKKLVACINIIEKVESLFWWKGKIEKAKEALLIIKSKKKNFSSLLKEVKKIHSYTVPEIISLEIKEGNKSYLDWINESC